MLETAKAHLEQYGKHKVLGGYLSITSDNKLARKLLHKSKIVIPSKYRFVMYTTTLLINYRIEMARIMTKDKPWIMIDGNAALTKCSAQEARNHVKDTVTKGKKPPLS